jgi:transcriptional regulator with XRE-family HTH domain
MASRFISRMTSDIRKKLKFTQLEAARLASGGKNAFSRYERGQTKPVAAVLVPPAG